MNRATGLLVTAQCETVASCH